MAEQTKKTTIRKMPKGVKAGNRSYEEVMKIVESVEKELKENPELADKLFPPSHERVF